MMISATTISKVAAMLPINASSQVLCLLRVTSTSFISFEASRAEILHSHSPYKRQAQSSDPADRRALACL